MCQVKGFNVGVAQLVEHGTHKPGVVGSIPTPDTKTVLKIIYFYEKNSILDS